MVNVLIYSVVLLLFNQPCYCLETVPVIVLNTRGINIMGANVGNPFTKITNDIFSDIVNFFVSKASVVLIFVESQLSIEDITKKDSQGSPFKIYLQDMVYEKKLLYLPSVIDPYSTLTSLLPAYEDNTYDLATAKKIAREFKSASHIYIKFEPAVPSVEKLRIHDLAMKTISRIVRSTVNGSVVTFYTGVKNPLVIANRPKPPVKKVHEKSLFVASNRALFRLTVVHEHRAMKKSAAVEHVPLVKREHEVVSRSGGNGQLLTTLSFLGFDLRFEFTLGKKDWVLDHIILLEADVEVGRANLGVGAPWRSSYHCGEALNIGNSRDGSTVRLIRYQWQPSRRSCELSRRGCESLDRSRSKEPKDIGKLRKPCKGKNNLDDSGNKNMEIDQTKQEAIEDAGSGNKNEAFKTNVSGEGNNLPFGQEKHQGNKNIGDSSYPEPNENEDKEKDPFGQNKNPVNEKKATPDFATSGQHLNKEKGKDPFGHNKHSGNKNINTPGYLITEQDANEEGEKDPFGQKNHAVNENKGTPDSSKSDKNVNKEKGKDLFCPNKHSGDKNMNTPGYLITEQDANEEGEQKPFGQKKHPVDENKGTPESSKSDQNVNKEKGKDPFGQNKHSGDKNINTPGYLITEQDANEEGEKDPFGQKKHAVDENKGTPESPKGDQKVNKEKGKDPFSQNKHSGDKNMNTPGYLITEQDANEKGEKDLFGQKKHHVDENKGTPESSKSYQNVHKEKGKDPFGQNKHSGTTNIHTPSYVITEQDANEAGEKDPFGQKKHPVDENKGTPDVSKSEQNSYKEKEKDPFGQKKHPSNNYISTDSNDKPDNLGEQNKSGDKNIPSDQNKGDFYQNKFKPKQDPGDTPETAPPAPPAQADPPSQTDPSNSSDIIDTTNNGTDSQIDDPKFGKTVDCGPYFNHEILSGLLVVFIILAMLFYGLETMMNLKPNDRFDDFGDKTFSIAEEK